MHGCRIKFLAQTSPEILSARLVLLHVDVEYSATTFIQFNSELFVKFSVCVQIERVIRDTLPKTSISQCNLFTGRNISEVILEKPQDGEHAQGT